MVTKKDIDNIISVICPNDEDFEKACISPAYLKKELEALALEQEPKMETVDSSTESTDSSTDCISREAAISAAKYIFESNSEMKAYCMMKMLEELPPAKPKEIPGEWQQDMDGTFLCSECGSGYKDQPTLMGKPMFAFCPICGCRMIKGVDE